jgi:hypothetical protein
VSFEFSIEKKMFMIIDHRPCPGERTDTYVIATRITEIIPILAKNLPGKHESEGGFPSHKYHCVRRDSERGQPLSNCFLRVLVSLKAYNHLEP